MKKKILGLALLSSVTSIAGVVGNHTGTNSSGENCSLDIATSVNEYNVVIAEKVIYPKAKYLSNQMTMSLHSLEKKINSGVSEVENFGGKSDGLFTQYQEVLKLQIKIKGIKSYSIERIKHTLFGKAGKWQQVYKCNLDS